MDNPTFWLNGIVAFCVLCVLARVALHHRTTYFRITRNGLFKTLRNDGLYGEYLCYQRLSHLERTGARFLFNVYLPTRNGTTEIDMLLITRQGVFVIESKNYSGWIFGNERYREWTQTLPAGRGKTVKSKFYNPIMQNFGHVEALNRCIDNAIPLYSLVVFSEKCTLKDVKWSSPLVSVITLNTLPRTVKCVMDSERPVLSDAEVQSLQDFLYPFTQTSKAAKAKHIQNVQAAQSAGHTHAHAHEHGCTCSHKHDE